MLGILLALQVNNWNEARKLKKTEQLALIEIRSDVQTTLKDVFQDSLLHKISLDAALDIMDFLNTDQEWHDSLALLFELAYYEFRISSIESSYRSLEAKGADLISDKQLRNMISSFYDYDIPWLRRAEIGAGRFKELLLDYYTDHFSINENLVVYSNRDIDEAKKARDIVARGFIPLDLEGLKQDPKFKVLLREVIYERKQVFDAYQITADNGILLIEALDKALN